jgi:TrmH family RNA methyltransferase
MPEKITSLSNQKIKNILQLIYKSAERKKQNLIVVEGTKELELALKSGNRIESVYFCPAISGKTESSRIILDSIDESKQTEITESVYEKIAYRASSCGIIAIIEPVQIKLREIKLSSNPFIIILESVEKPGNLGAILRTADAAKADAVIVCDTQTDIFNPNVIRSSIGCVFSQQIALAGTDDVLLWLKENKIVSYATSLSAVKFYHEADLRLPCAVVMGTESTGLTDKWTKGCDAMIKIPMRGKIDSLNVSNSTAIIAFEAMRQRGFPE